MQLDSKKVLRSWWYRDADLCRVFMHLLLLSDDEGGVDVSVRSLARTLGIGYQKVRTCLARLQSEGEIVEITQFATQFVTHLTIAKSEYYGDFQRSLQRSLQRTQKEIEIENEKIEKEISPHTPFKEKDKKEKDKDKENNLVGETRARMRVSDEPVYAPVAKPMTDAKREAFKREMLNDLRMEQLCMNLHISTAEYHTLAEQVFNDWIFANVGEHEWTAFHFLNVMRRKANELKKQKQNGDCWTNGNAGYEERQRELAYYVASKLASNSGNPSEVR